jgi:imidazoleglycerol-phosphate dehydratase
VNRKSSIARSTRETEVRLELNLDGSGNFQLETGLGFFDHMLSHVARHGLLDLTITAKGDLHVDEHHLIEDVGICFGKAINEALAEKKGIERFGSSYVTMDEALARTVLDLSGRSHFVFHAEFSREEINGFPLEMVREFFQAIAIEGRMNLHVALLYGLNAHHQVEAIFKSFGRALHAAVAWSGLSSVPSTKGVL